MSTQSRPNTPLDSSNRSSVSNTSFSSIDVNQFKRGDLPQKSESHVYIYYKDN